MAVNRIALSLLRRRSFISLALPTIHGNISSYGASLSCNSDHICNNFNIKQIKYYSDEAPLAVKRKHLPKKERMLALDWILEGIVS